MPPERRLYVRDLGEEAYPAVWRRMRAFTDRRDSTVADELWLVEHPPVFTLGQAGRREHILNPGDIPVVECDRGGQVTYHGPGQLVAYPLLDLQRLKLGVRAFVQLLEESLIQTLATFNIAAQRKPGAPGVYVDQAKIAALGLRIRRGCSFHGLSLNVAMELEPFQRINPCGYAGLQVVQMQDLMPARLQLTPAKVAPVLVDKLTQLLDCEAQWPGFNFNEPRCTSRETQGQTQL